MDQAIRSRFFTVQSSNSCHYDDWCLPVGSPAYGRRLNPCVTVGAQASSGKVGVEVGMFSAWPDGTQLECYLSTDKTFVSQWSDPFEPGSLFQQYLHTVPTDSFDKDKPYADVRETVSRCSLRVSQRTLEYCLGNRQCFLSD